MQYLLYMFLYTVNEYNIFIEKKGIKENIQKLLND